MIRAMRAYKKAMAVSLLLLSVSGGRVYALSDACDRTRVFFGPSLAFKMVAKSVGCAATHAVWQRPAPRSFGARHNRWWADDLKAVRSSAPAAPVLAALPRPMTLPALPRRAPPQTRLPLSCDLSPTPPLHTRK